MIAPWSADLARNRVIDEFVKNFGMAKNLIKNFDVYVIAHKNRDPINKLVKLGAKEILNYNDLLNQNLDCLNMTPKKLCK